ncbi:MAG TPA: 4Fe-4S dicluster domain-containing protein [Bacteroidales bacterium]|nr:4Fe-4S dicluster domain-containing protein [Bacteroidales bacterium]
MRRGFAYDAALCVSCRSCSAACILENGLQEGTRTIFSWNEMAVTPFSVINLSLACNHCADPACLSGCPAKAYTIDESGAVIHYAERCMGCRYCTLKCPYDAPKINKAKGYIEKCHFCHERAAEGVDPACVTACPTGALRIVYDEEYPDRNLEWFPETGIVPSVKISGAENRDRPLISPPDDDEPELMVPREADNIRREWSLLLFSLLVIAGAAAAILSYLADNTLLSGFSALSAALAMGVSFLHLGVKRKAWRALLNILSSPLSREIAALLLLFVMAIADFLKPGLLPPFLTPVMALLTLISVDMVYLSADHSRGMMLHSGQAFFSGLFTVSYFSGSVNAFILFTLLAAGSVVMRYRSSVRGPLVSNLYYYRAIALPLVLMLMYFTGEWATLAAGVLFIAGLAADRALYYDDFKPENIKDKITEHFYNEYEKERDKQRQDAGIS